MKRPVSNPLGLAILALTFEKPMHPYEMASTLRYRGKDESIKLNYGSLYTVIGSLERAGFIASAGKDREGARPERTVYRITPEGEVELFDWMRHLVGTPLKEYPQFEAALSLLPVLPPDEARQLLEQRVGLLGERRAAIRKGMVEAAKLGVADLFLIESEYEAAMIETERKWVTGLIGRIDREPDFTRGWKALHEERAKSKRSRSQK